MFEYDHIPEGDEIAEVREELQELADFIADKERLRKPDVYMMASPVSTFVNVIESKIYMPVRACAYGGAIAFSTIIHELAHLVVQQEWIEKQVNWYWKAHGNIFKSHEKRMLSCFGVMIEYIGHTAEWRLISHSSDNKKDIIRIAEKKYKPVSRIAEGIGHPNLYQGYRPYYHLSEGMEAMKVQIYLHD